MERMKSLGLTLNASKCEFGFSQVSFVGFETSGGGVSPGDKNAKSVIAARVPKEVSELRTFMGLVNFVGWFIPDLSTHAEPLLRLTKKGVNLRWGHEHDSALTKLLYAVTLALFIHM